MVTGASGFVAGELVKALLVRQHVCDLTNMSPPKELAVVTFACLQAKGYTVRGTVRSLADEGKVSHLVALSKALPGAPATPR